MFLVGALAVVAVGAVLGVIALSHPRDVITATPVGEPVAPLEKQPVRPRQSICVASVAFTPDAARLRFLIPELQGSPQPLRVRVRAAGVDESVGVPATYTAFSRIVVPFKPVPREALGSVCIRNAGRRPVNIGISSDPRLISRSTSTLGGKPYGNHVPLTLLRARQSSLLSRIGDVRSHIAAFKPGLAGMLLWPLFLALLVAVPALMIWAGTAAFRDGEADDASAS